MFIASSGVRTVSSENDYMIEITAVKMGKFLRHSMTLGLSPAVIGVSFWNKKNPGD